MVKVLRALGAAAVLGVVAAILVATCDVTEPARIRATTADPGGAIDEDDDPPPHGGGAPSPRTPRSRARVADAQSAPTALRDTNARVLRFVSSAGAAVPRVAVRNADANWAATSDAAGEVELVTHPGVTPRLEYDDGGEHHVVELWEPVTERVLVDVCEVLVDAVDSGTGRAIDGVAWRIGCDDDGACPRVAVSGASRGVTIPLREGRTAKFTFVADLVTDYVHSGATAWTGTIASNVSQVRLAVPLHPAVRREVRLSDARGDAVAGASVARMIFRGADGNGGDVDAAVLPEATSHRDGVLVLERLPAFPAARISFTFARAGRNDADATVADPDLRGTVDLRPADPAPAERPDVLMLAEVPGLLGSAGARFGGLNETLGLRGAIGSRRSATVRVRTLRRDGSPAAYVSVHCGTASARTDHDGRAAVPVAAGLAGVPATVVAGGSGFLPCAASCVADGAEVVLHEPAGRRVHVEVVAEDGTPLPAATVWTSGVTVPGPGGVPAPALFPVDQFDEGGAQVLRPLTDASGRVVVTVPEGKFRFRAVLGETSAAVNSSAERVRIVLATR